MSTFTKLTAGPGIAYLAQRLITGWTTEGSEFESRQGQKFSVLLAVQTGPGIHTTSYTMGIGGSFPGLKRPGREVANSLPASAEVKKMWIYTSTLRLHGVVLNQLSIGITLPYLYKT
jgi:hypothetical protein